jgi:hypothetical protein
VSSTVDLALDAMEMMRLALEDELKGVQPANEHLCAIRHALRALDEIVDEL